MKRLQKKEPQFRAEITAYVSLIFILMLSLVGALLESVSVQKTKDVRRARTEMALESVFAEYHQELLEQYDVFARFGCSEDVLQNRLEYYGANHMTHSVKRMELLTDYGGGAFYEQAVAYMKDWLGMEHVPDTEGGQSLPGNYQDVTEQEKRVSTQIEELFQQEEAQIPADNPLESVKRLKNTELLTLVAPQQESLSKRNLETATLASHRSLQKGTYGSSVSTGAVDKGFFTAYLSEHFSNFTKGKEAHALSYEQEYILGGYESDRENLEYVCKKILNLRMAANYLYLQTDSAKKAEAEAVAMTLCTLLTVPGITELVKQGILLAWAYGESIVDVRVLLKHKKVAAVKTAETWQLQLSNLVKLGTAEEVTGEKGVSTGLTYSDYLKGLLLIEEREKLCMRSLDLIESNLHIKTDQCMTKLELSTKSELRRGIKDTFSTQFGYQ